MLAAAMMLQAHRSIPARAGEPQCRRDLYAAEAGSIPARAGEPGSVAVTRCTPGDRVYPRACGGTTARTRSGRTQSPCRVYPRACGGTHADTPRSAKSAPNGLSPRVRGNPRMLDGSVPPGVSKVYPRACGGTPIGRIAEQRTSRAGLSPRVRGNPSTLLAANVSVDRVYPRACGGTVEHANQPPMLVMGLSPRVRGNRCQFEFRASCLRSIPARAGEPLPSTRMG